MYELLYIIPAPFTEKDVDGIVKKVNQLIKKFKGEIVKEQNLGNKKLAYPIKQIYKGFYILIKFTMDPSKIKELDKELKLLQEVLRHMITVAIVRKKPEKKIDKQEEKVDIKKLGKKIDNLLKT